MKILAAIVVALGIFGYFYYNNYSKESIMTNEPTTKSNEKIAIPEPSANNYEECIALGNPPLPDDNDKCLTKDGYMFIKGAE